MRSWRIFIHICCRDSPWFLGYFHQLINFLWWWNISFSYILDKNATLFVRSDLQIYLARIYKITYFLQVNLYHWYFNPELYILRTFGNRLKNLDNHSRYDAWIFCNFLTYFSLHSVGFARRCLPICKNSSVETFNNTFNNRGRSVVIYFSLFGVTIEDFIECKFKGLRIRIFIKFHIFDSHCFIIKNFLYSCIAYRFLSFI